MCVDSEASCDLEETPVLPESDSEQNLQTSANSPEPVAQPSRKRKRESTFSNYEWILSSKEGYYCTVCKDSRQQEGGPWITIPISKDNSKKLYKKAEKHANSVKHRIATETVTGNYESTVLEKVNSHANRQCESDMTVVKSMFRVAYFFISIRDSSHHLLEIVAVHHSCCG